MARTRATTLARDRRRSALKAALAITEKNRTQSPLLRLPGELRNQIYSHLLVSGTTTLNRYHFLRSGPTGDKMTIPQWYSLHSLISVCRDTRAEFEPLLHSLDTLTFAGPEIFSPWSKTMEGRMKSGIRCICFSDIYCQTHTRYFEAELEQLQSWPDLKMVVIEQMRGRDQHLYETALDKAAREQGGRWKWVCKSS
ncbi:hypothetical protein EKO04_002247 [Ascochyta lentis]|uniref:Uncharacterized protein n=1 Tax=Ascochyta lentis TaxID=205686 RepID=A0A8H7JB40_9PLEO|nr:hypothetical protein EKO04_002247 [Ascochyta lentis]